MDSVKIIVILREPVSRELSLYNHLAFECRRLGTAESGARIPCGYEWHRQVEKSDGSVMSFDDFVLERSIPAFGRDAGPGRSTRHGMYALHLRQWFDLFDREQILVLSYDEMLNHPETFQGRIQTFLGHKISGRMNPSNVNDSSHKVRHPTPEAKEALLSVLSPLNSKLYELLDANPGPLMEKRPFPKFNED